MKTLARMVAVLLALLLIGGACVMYSTELDRQIARQKDDVREWDDKITFIKSDIPRITRLRAEVQGTTRMMSVLPIFLGQVQTDAQRVVQLLDAVEKARPAALTVTRIALQPGGQVLGFNFVSDEVPCGGPVYGPPLLDITVQGGQPAVAAYRQALSKLPWCDGVKAGPVPGDRTQTHLEIRCKATART